MDEEINRNVTYILVGMPNFLYVHVVQVYEEGMIHANSFTCLILFYSSELTGNLMQIENVNTCLALLNLAFFECLRLLPRCRALTLRSAFC